jgi:hypothetical protein
MPRFKPNVPVTTEKPQVEVDTRGMNAGEYKFQLVVVDERGQESEPTVFTIQIGQVDRLRPSNVIVSRPTNESTGTNPNKPNRPDKPPKTPKSKRKSKGDAP